MLTIIKDVTAVSTFLPFAKATSPSPRWKSLSPYLEMGAYEVLWADPKTTWKRLADRFREGQVQLPSELVPHDDACKMADNVIALLKAGPLPNFGIRVRGQQQYPAKLRDAAHPVELLYYSGEWDLVNTRGVAVVGSRRPSPEGVKRARKLAKLLVAHGRTVVSGLAAGIDTAAHSAALEAGGRTVAVVGTALTDVYPKENDSLQKRIAAEHLVVSQVPIQRYRSQIWKQNRSFFPERNVTMSALTDATVIVEASETSGTLIQARAALAQGRKLFILDSCFQNAKITWPERFEKQGAIRVRDFDEIVDALSGGGCDTDSNGG